MHVSVCITSYQRPQLLREAVLSCLSQSAPPLEILIGDDSPDHCCVATARELEQTDRRVEFIRNQPALGKGRNIDMLLRRTRGDQVVLLHDDDYLLPGALERLVREFRNHPQIAAAFGPQLWVDHFGTPNAAATEELNRTYLRTPDRQGILSNPGKSALTGQFPNDGYMVDGALARRVGFYDHGSRGIGGDYRFAWNLARSQRPFFLLGEPVSAYRWTNDSMSSRGTDTSSFQVVRFILEEVADPALLADPEVYRWVSRLIKPAIFQAATLGQWKTGLRWYSSKFHRRSILTPAGGRRLMRLLAACLREIRPAAST